MPQQTDLTGKKNNGFSDSLVMLADLILERTGLNFAPHRLDLLADKLGPLLSEGRFDSFLDYYYFLKYDEHAGNAWQHLQTALAVNETYFWREYDQIRAVTKAIVPRLQRDLPRQPVRIWHAACATGEEPYSMAIALKETGAFERGQVEIMATDFNIVALAQARQGVYRQRSFRSIPADILQRYFTPLSNGEQRLDDSIRARVNFSYMNLLDESALAAMPPFDVILCRNVFIYFSDQAIRQVVGGFYRSLSDTGFLFVAAAESLLRISNLFELVEIEDAFGYQKRVDVNKDNGDISSSRTVLPWILKTNLDDHDKASFTPTDYSGDK